MDCGVFLKNIVGIDKLSYNKRNRNCEGIE